MKANPIFENLDVKFWANVKIVGQSLGYTQHQQVRTYSQEDLHRALSLANLGVAHLDRPLTATKTLAEMLILYFEYRAMVLNTYVQPRLMNAEQAADLLNTWRMTFPATLKVPMNKQSGMKRTQAYLTALVNLMIEKYASGISFNYDPRQLTSFTAQGEPIRTFSRRVDGCFVSTVNPVAIWEIKEYYHTTTFGSRIADGIYETLLDGMELKELRETENISVLHYLIVDAYLTWWQMGKSYLCRIIDILNMGYIDEVLFGREVVERLPEIVPQWVNKFQARQNPSSE